MKQKYLGRIAALSVALWFPASAQEQQPGVLERLTALAEEVAALRLALTARNPSYDVNLVPVGAVISYYGNAAPEGWLLCQGQPIDSLKDAKHQLLVQHLKANGLKTIPDLRGRFPLGGGQGSGLTSRSLGQSGGAETHTLTVAEMPAHKHQFDRFEYSINVGSGPYGDGITQNKHGMKGRDTSSVGGGQAHNTMPPFVVLNYIIKY